MRIEKPYGIGTPGAVYEFNVKLYRVDAPGMTDMDWEHERDIALEEFEAKLRRRYPWIGRTYFTGRSGGWLAIEDPDGRATRRGLETIEKLVGEAKKKFKREVEASAATGYYTELNDR